MQSWLSSVVPVVSEGKKGEGGLREMVFEKYRRMCRKKSGTFPEKIPITLGQKNFTRIFSKKIFYKSPLGKLSQKIPEIPSASPKKIPKTLITLA
jgi:hypothetical protein